MASGGVYPRRDFRDRRDKPGGSLNVARFNSKAFLHQFDHDPDGGFFERLAAAAERVFEFERSILHALVRLGGSADEEKVLGPGESLVSVLIIEPHAKETDHATFVATAILGHRVNSCAKVGALISPEKLYV